MSLNKILLSLVFVLAALPALAQQAASPLTRIGGAGAVRGSVNAIAPNGTVGRIVESGKPIYLNDHITTKADSRLQVMLLDETVFTMGPDSDMVLDEFVYDPNSNAGKVTARLTKGVFRFVSGKVARQGPDRMKINVPTGTMGIRGTWGAAQVGPNLTSVILGGAGPNNTAGQPAGHLHLESGRGSVELTRAGFGSDLRFNEPPTRPTDRTGDLERIDGVLFWKPRNNQVPNHPPGGVFKADAVQQTGNDVLTSLNSLQSTKSIGQQSGQNSQLTTQATQDIANSIGNGPATWDFILQQLTNGQGTYTGTGSYTCTGCSEGGTMTLQMDINFGARTIGGPGSQLSLSDTSGGPNPVNFGNDSVTIGIPGDSTLPISFATFSGPAKLTLQQGVNSSNSNFNGTTISLNNNGGTIAKQAAVNLQYSNLSSQTASGTVTGTR
jgi:hypothetical protein